MNIVIAGGQTEADFLIGSFLEKKHNLIVINEDANYCEYLASTHNIPIVHGVPYKQDTFTILPFGLKNFDKFLINKKTLLRLIFIE